MNFNIGLTEIIIIPFVIYLVVYGAIYSYKSNKAYKQEMAEFEKNRV